MHLNKANKSKFKFSYLIIIIIFYNYFNTKLKKNRKKIGVIGLGHSHNIGNNLVKFAIFIKLSELGYSPYIVERIRCKHHNISFISKTVNIKLIDNFSEIKEDNFDILMVNSDQTWRRSNSYFYDIAFLKFAENWKIPKFIYGASSGTDNWNFSKKDEQVAKHLLSNFNGISVREKSLVKLIENHLGFKAQFVLDPTLLINKNYYLNLIKDYKSNIIEQSNNDNFIFAYILSKKQIFYLKKYILYAQRKLNMKIWIIIVKSENQVKKFLYGIINCKAVITTSFHGTIFSIIFNKPFITFTYKGINQCRFKNLNRIINVQNRIFDYISFPSISLLTQPLNINRDKLMLLKKESINYLKMNLGF